MERRRPAGSADRLDSESTNDGQHETGHRQTGHGKIDAIVGTAGYNDANDWSD